MPGWSLDGYILCSGEYAPNPISIALHFLTRQSPADPACVVVLQRLCARVPGRYRHHERVHRVQGAQGKCVQQRACGVRPTKRASSSIFLVAARAFPVVLLTSNLHRIRGKSGSTERTLR